MYSPWIEEKETITKSGDGITGMKPSPRFQHVAVSMDNSIYIIGGTNGKKFFDEIYQYEPERHHWTCYKAHGKKNECKDIGPFRINQRKLVMLSSDIPISFVRINIA